MVVGAHGNDDAGNLSGSAYVFDRSQGGANNFGEVKKLTASDVAQGDQFGRSVAVSGDTVVVGARFDDDGESSGSTYVFDRSQGGANNFGEIKKLTASDAAEYDYFGTSVSISGDTVVVGAFEDGDGDNVYGSAFVFDRDQGGANNFGEVKKLTASDVVEYAYFGTSVSISGDTVVIGAPRHNDPEGERR